MKEESRLNAERIVCIYSLGMGIIGRVDNSYLSLIEVTADLDEIFSCY